LRRKLNKLNSPEKKNKEIEEHRAKISKIFNDKIDNAREREEKLRKEREREMNKKYQEAERNRMLAQKRKLNEQRLQQKNVFDNDQKHYFAQRNLSVTRQKEDDEEVKRKLEEFERSMISHEQNKQTQLKSAQQRAESHIQHVMEKLDQIKHRQPEDEMDYNELAKTFKKKIEAVKNRDRNLKHLRSKQSQALRNHQEQAKLMLQNKNKDNNDRTRYIIQRMKQRDIMLREKDKLREQMLMQRKEIQRLRRENHLYNIRREQMMSQDYKKRLMDKLQEKAIKADRVKERSKTAATATHSFLNMTVM